MTLPGADVCQPKLIPTPSGRRAWAHGDGCRVYPGKIISPTAPWHDGEPEAAPVCEEGARACKPEWRGVGSVGVRIGDVVHAPGLFHSASCPAHPGERIDVSTYAKGRRW